MTTTRSTSTTGRRGRGRGWAYAGAALGGAVSIAANVAHSYVPPAAMPASWRPEAGAVISAVFWPIALFVVVEILARIAWPAGRRWVALRYVGLLPVALVAGVVSYRHLSGLLTYYREDSLTATIGPLAVDGLMVMASGALIASARRAAAVADLPAALPAPRAAVEPAPDEPRPRTGSPGSRRTGTRTPGRTGRRTGTRAGGRTDAELTAALAELPRESDGTVPIRRATAALSCGPDRARRLLAGAGLLRTAPPSNDPLAETTSAAA
ncbi:MAG TPA: hypothetical protein VMU51_10815 [Mycobacteriales bacterium]|nr:hypothetical protein [Mycobacteriales bacterium]